jgi:chemotaxis protein methyltransferase CheR
MSNELGIRDIRQINNFIKDMYGVDYGEYALTSYRRRLDDFLNKNRYDINTLLTKLASPDFFDQFIDNVSVSDTEMFRDPTFWIQLKNTHLGSIIDKDARKIKVWLPLCASGEEYYSLAILLKECGWTDKIDVIVTSLSQESLSKIQQGKMPVEKVDVSTRNYGRFQGISQLSNYYKTTTDGVTFDQSLFRNTRFLKDDLSFKQEFGHASVVIFRNKLIYFTTALQNRVCDMIHGKIFARGILALGTLEELDATNTKFVPINKSESIYQRKS